VDLRRKRKVARRALASGAVGATVNLGAAVSGASAIYLI